MSTRLILRLLAVAALLAACEGAPRANPVWVEVLADAPVSVVAESLVAHGIIDTTAEFVRLAMKNQRYRDIKPGVYLLRPHSSSPWRVLSQLRRGTAPAVKVVVRERMTLLEVAEAVELTVGLPRDSFVAAAADTELRAKLGARGPTVEGYLHPARYYVTLPTTPAVVLRQMTDSFEAHWTPAWTARLDSVGITRDETVTLASIIAGEMPDPEDIARVAAVYHNRLSRGMRLQADPTVIYALGERRRLTNQDYRTSSAYNTYTIRGLPPGPIGQPSDASLEAALYPSHDRDLYFVGRRDGRHEFSLTYREHLRTIARIRGKKPGPPLAKPKLGMASPARPSPSLPANN